MNIYVCNLSYDVTEDELKATFEEYGQVTTATVIKDKYTSRSKGFGFVEMAEAEAAKKAIEALNGKEYRGRTVKVNEALPKQDRPRTPRTGGYRN